MGIKVIRYAKPYPGVPDYYYAVFHTKDHTTIVSEAFSSVRDAKRAANSIIKGRIYSQYPLPFLAFLFHLGFGVTWLREELTYHEGYWHNPDLVAMARRSKLLDVVVIRNMPRDMSADSILTLFQRDKVPNRH
jgi:hypothetical protein